MYSSTRAPSVVFAASQRRLAPRVNDRVPMTAPVNDARVDFMERLVVEATHFSVTTKPSNHTTHTHIGVPYVCGGSALARALLFTRRWLLCPPSILLKQH